MLDALRDMARRMGLAQDRHFSEDDTRLALAALLLQAADVDGEVSPVERGRVRDLLKRQYGLVGDDLDTLLGDALRAEQEAIDLYGFTSILKRQLSAEERLGVVRLLWEIVYADGVPHEFEENLVWRVAELLAVPREQRLAAKASVAERFAPATRPET
ncbi:TerB family tellurite resistance protein [Propylenella binzhouense]|uniref:TerB family tellurite resistance protein n=1 Tax=Propylenella binzhouense TaxID=2555902 RepID=A0A964T8U5_9HYPH|nr:TerB family tellurite resistance protein [Propylenella binzhouense]MYZ50200.1 TerB family tellurite resistance protein [Propylenella binzhouense]